MQEVNDLIAKHKGLVYAQLKKFSLIGDQDAESAAYWALYKAVSTYSTTKNTLLSTYATCCIYNALGDYVRSLHKKRQLEVISYNTIIFDNTEYQELLSDSETTEAITLRKELVDKTQQAIQSVLKDTKNQKALQIINEYIDNDYAITPSEIARRLGVSQSYASQTLAEFKFKIKKKMEDYYV